MAIFITWDDWGGWYDHVDPPLRDKWTGGSPKTGPSYTGTQFSYGTRVGCLVISPYAKRGISSKFHSHVSLVKFCEVTFGLKPINAREPASDGVDCLILGRRHWVRRSDKVRPNPRIGSVGEKQETI